MGRPHTEGIGTAIATMRRASGLTQSDLAAALRARGWLYDQSKVSRWERGVELPTDPEVFPAMEDECGARRGTIFRAAGWVVDDGVDIVTALRADKRLDDTTRRILISIYEEAVPAGRGATREASPAKADDKRPSATTTP